MKTPNILDRSFRYTNAAETDIRKTFARIRRELARAAKPDPGPRVATPPELHAPAFGPPTPGPYGDERDCPVCHGRGSSACNCARPAIVPFVGRKKA